MINVEYLVRECKMKKRTQEGKKKRQQTDEN